VLPPLLIAVGIAVCGAALVGLSRAGSGYRIGRTLAGAPICELADVADAARDGRPFVRVHGRIASDEEFPDENDRPLVYRRRQLELALDPAGRVWRTLEDEVHAVPFGIEGAGVFVAVRAADLDDGLVVILRESLGTAADAPGRVPPGTPLETPLRHRVHQISAVEHAHVAGRPTLGADGTPALGKGSGRPLILTTVEIPEAMRLLAAGHRGRVRVATFGLGAGAVAIALGVLAGLLALLR
jgi:hypothetical protein